MHDGSLSDLFGLVFEVWVEGDKTIAMSFPDQIEGKSSTQRTILEIEDGKVKRTDTPFAVYLAGYSNNENNEYSIAKLLKDGNDGFEFEYVEAQPKPFPRKKMKVSLYQDINDKSRVWGISECGEYTFSRSKRSWYFLMSFKVTQGKTREQRVDAKLADCFEYVGDFNFNPACLTLN